MTDKSYIKACPYCERYGKCPFSVMCHISTPVKERKQIARLCLQDVVREEQQGIYDGEPAIPPVGSVFDVNWD